MVGETKKYMMSPSISVVNKISSDISGVYLDIRSITCIRKNEISADEVVILDFWLLEKNGEVSVEGIIHLGDESSEEGESFNMNLSTSLMPNREKSAFCIMVYQGDFRTTENPLTYAFNFSRANKLELDAGDAGCYRLEYNLSSI